MTTKGKIFTWVGAIAALSLAAFIYVRFYFVFGDGVKAGELNQFMYNGYVWKTYEGKLIQSGFRGSGKGSGGAAVESYIFDFSGDIYGQTLRVAFTHRIRDEHKFDSTEALQAQMREDAKIVEEQFNKETDNEE